LALSPWEAGRGPPVVESAVRRSTRRKLIVVAVLGAGAVAIGLAVLLTRGRGQAGSGPPSPPSPPGVREPMAFSVRGVAGRVVAALELVVGQGRAQAALWPVGAARWVCAMVDGAEKTYDLDQGMSADAFAGLLEGGFQPSSAEGARTAGIYRAVARRAVPEFSELRGDRVLVLVCPKAEWPGLSLRWPPIAVTGK